MNYRPELSTVIPADYKPKTCAICGKVLLSIEGKEADTYIYRGPFEKPERRYLCLECWDKLWNERQGKEQIMDMKDFYATTKKENIRSAYTATEPYVCEHEGCAVCCGLLGEVKVQMCAGSDDEACAFLLLNNTEPVEFDEKYVPSYVALYFDAHFSKDTNNRTTFPRYGAPVFSIGAVASGDEHASQEINYCPFCGARLFDVWKKINE